MTINNHACNRTAGKLPFSRRLDEPLSCPQWQLRSVDHRQRWRAGGDLPSLRCHAFRSNGSSSRRQPVDAASDLRGEHFRRHVERRDRVHFDVEVLTKME